MTVFVWPASTGSALKITRSALYSHIQGRPGNGARAGSSLREMTAVAWSGSPERVNAEVRDLEGERLVSWRKLAAEGSKHCNWKIEVRPFLGE